jgi:hypothetical protein
MPDFFLAPAGLAFWQEVRESGRWPDRETASDGWLGDASHQARKSDHNPAYDEPAPYTGIVRAVDFDVGGWPGIEVRDFILERCRSGVEKRVQYVISNRTIWSATFGWVPRSYSGDNPHTEHTHYSLKHDRSNFDDSPWLVEFGVPAPPPPEPPEEDDDMPQMVNVTIPPAPRDEGGLARVDPNGRPMNATPIGLPKPDGGGGVKFGAVWLSVYASVSDSTTPITVWGERSGATDQPEQLWAGDWSKQTRLRTRSDTSVRLPDTTHGVTIAHDSPEPVSVLIELDKPTA